MLTKPKLSDGVITIKPFELSYAEDHLAGEDEAQIKWLSGGKATLEGVKKWIGTNQEYWRNNGPVFNFAIFNEDQKLIGMVEANTDYQQIDGIEKGDANISYGLYPFARSKGYASRAVKLMCGFLKTKGVKRAVIRVEPENHNSLIVPLRCGFLETGNIVTKDNHSFVKFVLNLKGK